ncbi:3-deoxy-D-manno-octulosonic acid transferase [Desulfonatronovibrio hydrogenovorans]|uniref:3-deoxy-D-manno-octulosonic acid transferase n=1 Tax=Desulfonatronovibrio hydrogenovorans TaxID=53245 RepID=UPI0006918FCF|nr:glycosyltransferase N-terminal domain-containing protein [Desulfonatronovibrio hydrogenovorans]
MNKSNCLTIGLFNFAYAIIWIIALPILVFIKRLRPIAAQRFGIQLPQGPFDLWIQAASVGEARLALHMLLKLPPDKYPRVLITTNTRQGMETLQDQVQGRAELSFFPFDIPLVWAAALRKIKPARLILMETEIWPALLQACQKQKIPVTIGNARVSLKSFCRYYSISGILNTMAPGRILAVSDRDQKRFSWIFPGARVESMHNIKFDITASTKPIPYVQNPLSSFFKPGHPLIVLASIREQEESKIQWVIEKIIQNRPKTTIALFPRHMQRLPAWKTFFEQCTISWSLRSSLSADTTLPQVVLWDKFGELLSAYALAKSVYVGGSLVPCGGQNFLEPLSQGVSPCIGPFWENFHWVGQELVSSGLVWMVKDEKDLYHKLTRYASSSRDKVFAGFSKYVEERQGGSLDLINSLER